MYVWEPHPGIKTDVDRAEGVAAPQSGPRTGGRSGNWLSQSANDINSLSLERRSAVSRSTHPSEAAPCVRQQDSPKEAVCPSMSRPVLPRIADGHME